MKERKVRYWIAGGVAVLIAGLAIGGLGVFGTLPWQGGDLYKDPQGRYTDEIFTAYVADHHDLQCEPGKYSNNANSHYLALARIIEDVSGGDVQRERLPGRQDCSWTVQRLDTRKMSFRSACFKCSEQSAHAGIRANDEKG